MVSKILVGMSTADNHLLQFKIQSHLHTHKDFAGTSDLLKKKCLTLHCHFVFLSEKFN